jgi:hypothetical protein
VRRRYGQRILGESVEHTLYSTEIERRNRDRHTGLAVAPESRRVWRNLRRAGRIALSPNFS